LGVITLSLVGTMLPWVLFAFGQARVPAVVAGAFINIEPLVGAAAAALFFGETITVAQVGAGLAILTGVALSTLAAAESGAQAEDEDGDRPPEPVRLPRQRRRAGRPWELDDISADVLVLDRAA
jgi:hypothetical protein